VLVGLPCSRLAVKDKLDRGLDARTLLLIDIVTYAQSVDEGVQILQTLFMLFHR
jgi:hypothetical protein